MAFDKHGIWNPKRRGWFDYDMAVHLCNRYNHATSPSRYLSDHEHKRTRQLARAIISRLNRMHAPWKESDYSGRISVDYYVIEA